MGRKGLENLAPLEFFGASDRERDQHGFIFVRLKQFFPNRLRVVVGDWLTCCGVDQFGDIRKPDFEEIAELGDGADCGAGGLDRIGLLDRDGGANVLDRIDFGPIHQVHELARVGGECLDVATLPFRVQRLKYKRGLTRATESGHHGELTNG